MMALVLVCVVETGMPSTVMTSRHSALDRSAEKPWYFYAYFAEISITDVARIKAMKLWRGKWTGVAMAVA